MELNDVLSDEEPKKEAPAPERVEAPEGVAPRGENQQRARNREREAQEAGNAPKAEVKAEETPKEAPKVEPPKQELSDKERAAFAKASDEARKRQEWERKYAELEAKVNAAPKEPEKSFYDDPDAKIKTWQEQQAAFKAEMHNTLIMERLGNAEMIARSKYPDFEEKSQAFAKVVEQTPGLWQQALRTPNPAEFVYQAGKNHLDLQAAGSIDTLKANLEKELRLKIEQEYKDKQEAAKKERDSIPSSLSQARGTNQNRPVWNGPPPLDSILGD